MKRVNSSYKLSSSLVEEVVLTQLSMLDNRVQVWGHCID